MCTELNLSIRKGVNIHRKTAFVEYAQYKSFLVRFTDFSKFMIIHCK